jgi:hypothetical protein
MIAGLAILFIVASLPPAKGAMPSGFVALRRPPTHDDLDCANYSRVEWFVSSAGNDLRVSAPARADVVDPLPFTYDRHPDRAGDRHALRMNDGWFAGFDAGEFGGGLWWFSSATKQPLRVRPPAADDVHHVAENVHGFAQHPDGPLVFMGLDHLTGRSGHVFALRQIGGAWQLQLFAALDASPAAWVMSGDRAWVLTESGLWEAAAGNRTRKLHALDVGSLYPSSMVLASDGALYVGMRRYVLRLQLVGARWAETWFVTSNCVRTRLNEYDCQCVP